MPAPVSGSACVFCAILRGDQPAAFVFDEGPGDDRFAAFLDTRPLFKGHTLLVPRAHHVTLPDLPPDLVGPLFSRAQRLAKTMESTLGAAGSFVALNNTVSQSVPHLHVHVVPRNRRDGLKGFFWPRTRYDSDDEMADHARRLGDGFSEA